MKISGIMGDMGNKRGEIVKKRKRKKHFFVLLKPFTLQVAKTLIKTSAHHSLTGLLSFMQVQYTLKHPRCAYEKQTFIYQ